MINDQTDSQCASELLNEHLSHIDLRITELSTLQAQLIKLKNRGTLSDDSCGIFQELVDMSIKELPTKSHI